MSSSSEQTLLSDFIKGVHKLLRKDTEVLGVEQAWQKHCSNKTILRKYAQTMETLAVHFWEKSSTINSKSVSRIQWIYESSKRYFEEIEQFRSRELKLFAESTTIDFNFILSNENKQWKLLDVGSCYNPFMNFSLFKVTALDIAPAHPDVFLCDFLNVRIADQCLFEDKTILELERGSFHIVVFSLFLEYFPDPKLRLRCCEKAYNLLYPEGILVIATPDSNHVGSNAKIFKSWKYVLSRIGFYRVYYEKLPHLHCMIFRKTIVKDVAHKLANIYKGHHDYYDQIFIPQDFNVSKNSKISTNKNKCLNDSKWIEDTFLNNFIDKIDLFD